MEYESGTAPRDESGTGELCPGPESRGGTKRKWSGRYFSDSDLEEIRRIIAADQKANRTEIARRVCVALDWRRANGEFKEMRARVVLLRMHESGMIELPPPRRSNGNRTRQQVAKQRSQSHRGASEAEVGPAVVKRVDQLGPLKIERITRKDTGRNREWRHFISQHHYLGWTPVVGAQLRYAVSAQEQLLALISFGAASWKVACRDRWIGWEAEQREQRLPWIINNTRYLILPWVRSKNLASAILGTLAKRVVQDWKQAYGIEPVLMETFVDRERFAGTCYKAANWTCVGQTKGRGKYDRNHKHRTSIKDVWIYPLRRNPAKILNSPRRLR